MRDGESGLRRARNFPPLIARRMLCRETPNRLAAAVIVIILSLLMVLDFFGFGVKVSGRWK